VFNSEKLTSAVSSSCRDSSVCVFISGSAAQARAHKICKCVYVCVCLIVSANCVLRGVQNVAMQRKTRQAWFGMQASSPMVENASPVCEYVESSTPEMRTPSAETDEESMSECEGEGSGEEGEAHQRGSCSAASGEPSCAEQSTAKAKRTVGIIYKLTSPSGKSYVGQTVQALQARLGGHRCRSRCFAIGAAIKKYGLKAFLVEVLAINVPIKEIDEVEDAMILEHDTLAPGGYNLVRGRPEADKAARYQRFSGIAKKFSNTESFREKKRTLWRDPDWAAAWRATWMEKRESVLEGLDGRKRELKLLDHKRNDRVVKKRKAMKSEASKKEWEEEYSHENIMLRRRQRFLKQRVEKMKAMSTVDGLDYIRKATTAAIKATQYPASKASPSEQQRWYPNVFTPAEIAAVRANGGCWPT